MMDIISKNFEMRFISNNQNANGETDFKGDTSTLTTQQRIDYLNAYARKISEYAEDFSLEKQIVPMEGALERLNEIKPQPLPKIRKRIVLDEWKWIGYCEDEEKQHISKAGEIVIEPQDWRCFLEWEFLENAEYENCEFSFGGAAVLGFDNQRKPYFVSNGNKQHVDFDAEVQKLKVELDFVYKKWNLYFNDQIYADFVDFADMDTESVSSFESCVPGGQPVICKLWGVGYHRQEGNDFEPYTIKTFIDEDFKEPVNMSGWNLQDYDDREWMAGILPIVHGGERYAGQDLYLRKEVFLTELLVDAELYIESLTPGGEVYVNGRLAAFIQDECCHKINLSDYITEGKNLIAIRVYADKIKEQDKMTHTHTDLYTGWFAGRMHLDLLPEIYIEDVFSWTDHISGGYAVQNIEVGVKAKRGMASADASEHEISVHMMPWFPEEGEVCAETIWRTKTVPNLIETTKAAVKVDDPMIWSSKSPALYKLEVVLADSLGNIVDDYCITVGVRTVSQDGGVFRINGKPELLRAPLLFGARPPLDRIAAWEKCPPAEYYVQEMLMVQKMNGNGLRMSVHDRRMGGINDPRICEIADQMGIMLIWQTSTWLRITCASNLNLTELSTCIKQVRNHCSIVMWQPTNHPSWKNWDVTMQVYRMLYETITAVDGSRLISPSADSRRMYARFDDGMTDFWGKPCESCDPAWTQKGICRGNMDYILGYGNEWSALRQWPNVEEKNLPDYMETTAYISSFINSPERAYFNFEHDEIAGQPNWDIHKGKPTYHLDSYEKYYEEGSIGRPLSFDEWLTSQAWQALGAYETICKCRWLDYDGLSWCNLRGGQNTGTYQKSLIDYYGQPKLAYYTHRLAFQDVLACSQNVDMVYGPEDTVPVIVMNIGEGQKVNVLLEVFAENGAMVHEQRICDVELTEGRNVSRAADVKLPKLQDGLYTLQYTVYQE